MAALSEKGTPMGNEANAGYTKIDSSEPSGPGLYLVAGEDVAWGGPDTHFKKFRIGADYLLHLKTEPPLSYEYLKTFQSQVSKDLSNSNVLVVSGGLDDDLKLYHVKLPYTFETMEF